MSSIVDYSTMFFTSSVPKEVQMNDDEGEKIRTSQKRQISACFTSLQEATVQDFTPRCFKHELSGHSPPINLSLLISVRGRP